MKDLSLIVEPLLTWYEAERRILPWREDPLPYHVWVSEIMLQQTRVEAVIDYYHRFLALFPDVKTLAEAEGDEVRALWQGLGYYRRCDLLHKAAKVVSETYDGEIPSDHKTLLSLPGIGRYTAAAILSIGFGKAYPAVDGNVLRVMARLCNNEDCIDDEATKRRVEGELAKIMPSDRTSAFTQALMDLGATVCLPNGEPKCSLCPWQGLCEGKDRAEELPIRKIKKPRAVQDRTVFLFTCGDCVAIRKRPSRGLLAKMWEFPNEEGIRTEKEVLTAYPGVVTPLGRAKHIFSHIEWHMVGYRIEVKEPLPLDGVLWIKKEEIADYAIPSAFSCFKKQM